jgi:hypothetical protein
LRINITRDYPYNFIVIRNEDDALHPEGNSDLKELKNIIILKNFILKTLARYVKKATVPSYIAIYKSSLKETELRLEAQAVASNLSGVENGVGIALPNIDSVVSLLPTAQTDFIRILGYLDSAIMLKILGTSLLGGQSEKGGSYASAKVGATELENAIKQVALTLQNVDNIIIKYAIWQRFGTDTILPKLLFDLAEKQSIEGYKFMAEYNLPVDFASLLKSFDVSAKLKEPTDGLFYLGSPDGTLEGLMRFKNVGNSQPMEIISEEDRLKKDADRKQTEEAKKLDNKEL